MSGKWSVLAPSSWFRIGVVDKLTNDWSCGQSGDGGDGGGEVGLRTWLGLCRQYAEADSVESRVIKKKKAINQDLDMDLSNYLGIIIYFFRPLY